MVKLTSVLTDDLDHCMYTGSPIVERHHVFGGFNRKRSTEYGFIAPLHPTLHPNGVQAGDRWKEIDLELKQMCQRYYEEHHGSREEFIQEFGRSYIDESRDENKSDGDSAEEWLHNIGF